jgi:hypothetical protein
VTRAHAPRHTAPSQHGVPVGEVKISSGAPPSQGGGTVISTENDSSDSKATSTHWVSPKGMAGNASQWQRRVAVSPWLRAPPAARWTKSAARAAGPTARAGNGRFGRLSALCAHTKAPYKMDFHRKTLRPLNRSGRVRTVGGREVQEHLRAARRDHNPHQL